MREVCKIRMQFSRLIIEVESGLYGITFIYTSVISRKIQIKLELYNFILTQCGWSGPISEKLNLLFHDWKLHDE